MERRSWGKEKSEKGEKEVDKEWLEDRVEVRKRRRRKKRRQCYKHIAHKCTNLFKDTTGGVPSDPL